MEMLYMLTHHSRLMWYVMDSSVVKNVFALQSGTRDTHPLASEAEEVDDIIEDSGIFARDSHTGKVQKWLKGLCHWHRAFVDLGNKGAIVKLLAPRKLQIKVVEAMPIAEPTKQAPLSQTLMALRPLNQEFEKAARDSLRYQMQYAKGGGGMGMVLAGDGSCDKEWSQLFKGRAHCEAYLACDVETQISIKEIGVSKRCCYCCAGFLKALEPNVKYTRSDDRVYPWAPPANAPRPAKEAVLKALQDKLYEHIVVRRHGDSGAGSDDEATGGVMVPKLVMPKTETWNLNPPSPA
ncbi:hypothetical protein FRB93_006107 [Tulasnella sp. JGI-2019a]|nr:hypothetical protein FRB93_006107 [Tulasnella sp. JGI-2019a]